MDIDEKEILFNKFKILKCYKKDEFSAVYLANHIYLEKKVFLKILDTKAISDINIVERFKREARILAKLDHPNIIKVYDFGTSRKFFYISFEYFASQNLREFVHKKNIKESVKKDIVVQLFKGLSYIHSKNIIHRDIKPENILINENIHLKLTDFGLAQISHDQNITQKFAVVGTPAYMSPEQIHGEELTIKSDLFSLGITIFELYEGNNPFLGKDSNGTISNILSFSETEIENKFNDFPDEINEILKKILVAEPSKRANNISNLFNYLGIDQKEAGIKRRKSGKFKILFPIILLISSVGLFLLIFEIEVNDNDSTFKAMNENKHDTVSNILNLPTTIVEDSEEKAAIPEKSKDISINIDSVDNSENKTKTVALEEKGLEIEFGELYVNCYPWAKIHINNEYVDTTPLRDNIKLLSGDYLLTLLHPDYPDFSDSISIKSSETYSFEINLDTLLGFFNCQVYPWCEVYINGEMKGITPFKSPIALYPGNYDLELRNPDYDTHSTKINIIKNDTLSLKYNLENLKNK